MHFFVSSAKSSASCQPPERSRLMKDEKHKTYIAATVKGKYREIMFQVSFDFTGNFYNLSLGRRDCQSGPDVPTVRAMSTVHFLNSLTICKNLSLVFVITR